jgi:adenylylsulfate kinase
MTVFLGAGKTTIAQNIKAKFLVNGYAIEALNGDVFRKNLCQDLGLSKEHRCENIRRMAFVANHLAQNKITVLI